MRVEEIDALLGGEAQRLADKFRNVPLDFMDGYGWAVTQICRMYPDAVPVEWIPCSKRLPDDDRTKVVTLANGNTECGYYSNGYWWCIGESITLENPTVIAWAPLPKPYEVEE